MPGNLSLIPIDVVHHQILPYFDYFWILNTGLVCKDWNENYTEMETFYFPINFKGTKEQLSEFMNERNVGELGKVTKLTFESKGNVELEREFISKMKRLKELEVFGNIDESLLAEFVSLENLESFAIYSQTEGLSELVNCKSKVKSFKASCCDEINFMNLGWPLERLDISGSYLNVHSIYKTDLIRKLKKFQCDSCLISSNFMVNLLEKLESVTELDISDNLCDNQVWQSLSELLNVKVLNCDRCKGGNEGIQCLGKLLNLEELHISWNDLTKSELYHIENLKHLTTLDISSNQIGDEGVKHLTALYNLTNLNVSNNSLGDEGANHLSSLENIQILNIYSNSIGEEGLKNFGKLKSLREIDLTGNKIGNGFRYLFECKLLKNIFCSSTNLNDQLIIDLCNQDLEIEMLEIDANNLSGKCCQFFSKLIHLKYVNISYNPNIGNEGFSNLESLNLTNLRANDCSISDEGLIRFLTTFFYERSAKRLSIHIALNTFTNVALEELLKYVKTKQIRAISLSDNSSFTNDTKRKLKQILPDITFLNQMLV